MKFGNVETSGSWHELACLLWHSFFNISKDFNGLPGKNKN